MSDFWERKSPIQKAKFILGIIGLVLIVVFTIANWRTIPFSLIFIEIKVPLIVLILGSILFGYILASITEGIYKQKRIPENKEELPTNISTAEEEE